MSDRRGLGPRLLLAALAAAFLAPLLPILPASLSRGWFFPDLLPRPSLAAWAYAASPVSGIPAALANSVAIATATAVLAVAAALPAGLALGRRDFRGKGLAELLLLAPAATPGIAVAMGAHALMLRLGLAGTAAGVVALHLMAALPYALLAIATAAALGDGRTEAAARTLGAGPLRTAVTVTLPALAPGVAVGAAFAFLVSWSQYGPTLLIGGGRVTTLPLILTQFLKAGRIDVAGVAAILTVVPGVAVVAATTPFLARLVPAGRERAP